MRKPVNKGLRNALIAGVLFLLAGIGYYVFIRITGTTIHCTIRSVTGYLCPTCGITHMFMNLFEFKFAEAFRCNPFMFITWPLIGAEILYIFYVGGNNRELPKWNYIVLYIYIGLLISYGIIRNVI